jgi:hypothetical protein
MSALMTFPTGCVICPPLEKWPADIRDGDAICDECMEGLRMFSNLMVAWAIGQRKRAHEAAKAAAVAAIDWPNFKSADDALAWARAEGEAVEAKRRAEIAEERAATFAWMREGETT